MITEILILFALILINGLFSSSEIAFLSINHNKLEVNVKNKNKKFIKIKSMLEDTSSFLATIQIGITLAGFLASAFASETFADYIAENVQQNLVSPAVFKGIVVVIITIVLSYFTLVLGELVPKKIGLAYPEKVAIFMVDAIYILMKITYPFVVFLKFSTNLICNIFNIKEKEDEAISEEEIKVILDESTKHGKIENNEQELIYNVFKFNDTEISSAMTKSESTIMISESLDIREVIDVIRRYKYTRFPVHDANDKTKIIGILNIKDVMLKCTNKNSIKNFNVQNVMRRALYIYDNEKVDDVFRVMQHAKISMAIVCNKDKNFVGIVTIEDLIEELVGNISDEFI